MTQTDLGLIHWAICTCIPPMRINNSTLRKNIHENTETEKEREREKEKEREKTESNFRIQSIRWKRWPRHCHTNPSASRTAESSAECPSFHWAQLARIQSHGSPSSFFLLVLPVSNIRREAKRAQPHISYIQVSERERGPEKERERLCGTVLNLLSHETNPEIASFIPVF